MPSALLAFVRELNRPLEKFVIKNGWYLRLLRKKIRGAGFKKLTPGEKRAVRQYWRQYGKRVSPLWAAYYSYASDCFDPRYIPESLFYSELIQKLGDGRLGALDHKGLQEQIFSSKQPKVLIRKSQGLLTGEAYMPISMEEAVALCLREGEVIIKPGAGSYGQGIEFWSAEEGAERLQSLLGCGESLVVQEIVRAHPFFSQIHPPSLNTLRLVTLIVDNQAVLLSAILRMGIGAGRIDNTSAGSLIAVVDGEGRLRADAVQKDQRKIRSHPDSFVFEGAVIPFFDRLLDDMYSQCWRIPYFRLVFWDYVIDSEDEPVLIEANFPAGQIESHQFNKGPLFGDYTSRVLDFVYKDKPL